MNRMPPFLILTRYRELNLVNRELNLIALGGFIQFLRLDEPVFQGCYNCAVYNLHNGIGGLSFSCKTLPVMYLNFCIPC